MRRFFVLIRQTIRWLLAVAGSLAGLALLAFAVTYGIIRAHFDGTANLPADCAVVFGAAVAGYDLPGPAIQRRVGTAADLYHAGHIRRLILSGGVGKGSGLSESEAIVMSRHAVQLGVDPAHITLEPDSHSTWENLRYSRNLTNGCESVVGISDAFHLARIEFLSWRQGWGELDTVPATQRPPERSERQSVQREVFAMLYYAFYLDRAMPGLQRHY